ncbi:hypothetical protein [Acinetobacter sp. ANC 4173]|uniref:hypothetical protein n=1 Tax=Acinetobacter sp. ANC 4173 TaxID=2529837 RepID=UPI00103B2CA7|nr:hypothetical protein [Acinetobacter sp. ANC 4173]TCB81634.1 hypothetical protein E0H94_03705 [Acinetobacter sp. ANC 4173]
MDDLKNQLESVRVSSKLKAAITRDFLKFKNNIQFFILVPGILGALWQSIELAKISPSYLRFFSMNQMIPDGASVLFILFICYFSYLVIITITAFEFFKYENLVKISEKNLISIILLCTFFLILAIHKYITFNQVSFSDIFLATGLLIASITFTRIIFKCLDIYFLKSDMSLKYKAYFDKDLRFHVFMLVCTIFVCVIYFQIKSFASMTMKPSNINNFTDIETKLIKEYKLCENPKLLYFNRDYLFYEIIVDKIQLIQILETKELFEKSTDKKDDND